MKFLNSKKGQLGIIEAKFFFYGFIFGLIFLVVLLLLMRAEVIPNFLGFLTG